MKLYIVTFKFFFANHVKGFEVNIRYKDMIGFHF